MDNVAESEVASVPSVEETAPDALFPSVTLASGKSWKIRKIMLFPEQIVTELANLRVEATKLFGGFSTGIGFLGSPSWVLGGAAALGAIEDLVSKSMKKKGVEVLRQIEQKAGTLASSGVYFEATRVIGLSANNPASWHAYRGTRFVHDGSESLNVETDEGVMSLKWSFVAAYQPPPLAEARTEPVNHPDVTVRKSRGPRDSASAWPAETSKAAPKDRGSSGWGTALGLIGLLFLLFVVGSNLEPPPRKVSSSPMVTVQPSTALLPVDRACIAKMEADGSKVVDTSALQRQSAFGDDTFVTFTAFYADQGPAARVSCTVNRELQVTSLNVESLGREDAAVLKLCRDHFPKAVNECVAARRRP
jgi:hypothetical protein